MTFGIVHVATELRSMKKRKKAKTHEAEKMQQILSMPNIYSAASQVIIWLGEKSEDSDRALNFVTYANQQFDRLPQYGAVHTDVLETHKLGPSDLWASVGKMFQRSWFHRCPRWGH